MPSRRRWIKQNAGSLQRGKPCALRIPLIPTHERSEFSSGGIKCLEAQITGREIKFLVVKRIVGNVHLAVDSAERAIGLEDCSRVVIYAGRTFLEERRDQHNFIIKGRSRKLLRARTGDRFREIKESSVFALAKILRLEELRQTHYVGALACGIG